MNQKLKQMLYFFIIILPLSILAMINASYLNYVHKNVQTSFKDYLKQDIKNIIIGSIIIMFITLGVAYLILELPSSTPLNNLRMPIQEAG